MRLFTIEIRDTSINSTWEIVCGSEEVFKMTYILDNSPNVLEYKVFNCGATFTNDTLGYKCEKLVSKFDWSKEPPVVPFIFEDEIK